MNNMLHTINLLEVEKIYAKHKFFLDSASFVIGIIFNFPSAHANNEIKKVLTDQKYRAEIQNFSLICLFISTIKLLGFWLGTIISFLIPRNGKKTTSDITFEFWANCSIAQTRKYYSEIKNIFYDKSFHELYLQKSKFLPINIRNSKFSTRLEIIISLLIFWPILFISSILFRFNFIQITLGLTVRGLQIQSDFNNHSSKILISSGDVYFGGLKYGIIKSLSYDNVSIIQGFVSNGGQTSLDNYRTCDCYFLFSKKQKELMPNIQCDKCFFVGNFSYFNSLECLKNDNSIDVSIVEHFPDDIPGLCSSQAVFDLINLCKEYSIKNPDVKICYLPRPNREGFIDIYGDKAKKNLEKLDSILSNAKFLYQKDKSSLELIAKSKVVVSYTSMMWLDSIALDKKVLIFNPEKLENRPHNDSSPFALVKNDYNIFSQKIESLLQKDFTKELYQLKKEYMFFGSHSKEILKKELSLYF